MFTAIFCNIIRDAKITIFTKNKNFYSYLNLTLQISLYQIEQNVFIETNIYETNLFNFIISIYFIKWIMYTFFLKVKKEKNTHECLLLL